MVYFLEFAIVIPRERREGEKDSMRLRSWGIVAVQYVIDKCEIL